MSDPLFKLSTAFVGHRLLASGELVEVALAVKAANENGVADPVLVFDDATGRVIDLDLRGTKADVVKRLSQPVDLPRGRYAPKEEAEGAPQDDAQPEPRGRGRPRLGVVSREVTLLPRQWEWLSAQPGGASAVLRRLVDDARRNGAAQQRQQRRAAQEAAYHVMLAVGGNLPGYEEATRALFADDREGLEARIAQWPDDVRAYVLRLAFAPASA
ncbi:Uncharacterized protein conserved in bacteria [Bordetella ansorpii]|uniref:Uncharacterized protein conserved in bacteria n=1 Tax=Bordetella ansorpii TaxID=288768 RepID=A0A157LHZ8_9BORD|nr:DUF2239 family protein [Bordetella ansorpii]SAH96337.1 Uncharacterized protein conserved in bacteria [Bordetella ansorpii]